MVVAIWYLDELEGRIPQETVIVMVRAWQSIYHALQCLHSVVKDDEEHAV
jgi:hypothetical protein